jgi:prophage regulatory protein
MGRSRFADSAKSSPAQLNTPSKKPSVERKVIRMNELVHVVGLSRGWINKLVRKGAFPKPIKLGPRSIGFLATEIDAYLEQLAAERDLVAS